MGHSIAIYFVNFIFDLIRVSNLLYLDMVDITTMFSDMLFFVEGSYSFR